jgi:hypothetical protein
MPRLPGPCAAGHFGRVVRPIGSGCSPISPPVQSLMVERAGESLGFSDLPDCILNLPYKWQNCYLQGQM